MVPENASGGTVQSDGVATTFSYKIKYTCFTSGALLQAHFANILSAADGSAWGQDNANSITLRCSLETQSGTRILGLWDNNTQNRVLTAGEIDVACRFGCPAVAGQVYYIHVNVTVTSGQRWPVGPVVFVGSGDGWETGADRTISGAYSGAFDTYAFVPIAVTAIPYAPAAAVLVKGDSIVVGGTGRTQTYGNYGKGAICRSLTSIGVAWGTEAINGAALNAKQSPNMIDPDLNTNTKPNNRVLDRIASYYTHFIQELGTNDINLGVAVSIIKTHMANWHRWAKGNGLVVSQQTITVWSSFDATKKSALVSLNTDIRAKTGLPDIDYILEVADLWETARNSGTINASLTTDGVHPNDAGVTSLAASLAQPLRDFTSVRTLI